MSQQPPRPDPESPGAGSGRGGWRGTSMALIEEIMERPLDPGYAAEAEARRRAGRPSSTGYRTPLLLVASIVIGALLAVAAASLRAPETEAQQARAQLISQVRDRQDAGDDLAQRITLLRAQTDQLQTAALGGDDRALATKLEYLSEAVGAVALSGPGVVVTMDDAPGTDDAATGQDLTTEPLADPGRVTSRDLQMVVNGLWAAGAEAISVNGQRLTVHSAIRFAGEAILVDFRGLARPYVITAIGAPDEMLETFENGSAGRYLASLHEDLGIVGQVVQEESVTVAAASRLSTRLATPMREPQDSPTAEPGPSTTGALPLQERP